ncbi:MAG TPA: VCBS repeat-containing protein, partial [Rhizomicrobium sp.]
GILHSGDAGKSWTLREIGRVPAAHRVRFADIAGDGHKDLLVAPVLNQTDSGGLSNPAHLPVPLYLFRHDNKDDWQQETITQSNMGLVHAVQPYDWDQDHHDEVLTAGFSGVFLHKKTGSTWARRLLATGDPSPWPDSGASEVAIGHIANKRFFATIEHFHGNMMVVYLPKGNGYQRHVIDTGLVTGHALLIADMDGDGVPQIVAAGDGSRANLFYYKAADASGLTWTKMLIDDDIAASSCVVADINDDGRPDIACMDNRKPNFIKWYEYHGSK